MRKRWVAVASAAVLILAVAAGFLPGSPAKAEAADRVSARLELLREKYPHDSFWNHKITKDNVGQTVNGTWDETWCDSVTDHPCNHSFDQVGKYGCNAFDHGIACWGFANRVFYDVFGARAYSLGRRYDAENISPGDHVRFRYNHSAIVLSRSGNRITLLECNYNNAECRIRWDRTDLISNVLWYQHAANWDQVADGEYEGIGAESGACGIALIWSLEKGVLSVSGTGDMVSYSATVGPGWESRKAEITSVVIGSGVTGIGAYTFSGCTNLRSVQMANTVKVIGEHAFRGCTALTDVWFGGDTTAADAISVSSGNSDFTDAAWHYASGTLSPDDPHLKVLTLPDSLRTVDQDMFVNALAQKIIVPSGVKTIKSHAFQNCGNLIYLELLNGSTVIADDALEGCGSVTVICPGNSSVESWAKEKGYPVLRR